MFNPFKMSNELAYKVAVAAGLFLLASFVILYYCSPPSEPIPPERESIYMCEYFIKKNANDPSSIEFNRDSERSVKLKDGSWFVTMDLRARNRFNALVRINVECNLADNGQGSWGLIDISLV